VNCKKEIKKQNIVNKLLTVRDKKSKQESTRKISAQSSNLWCLSLKGEGIFIVKAPAVDPDLLSSFASFYDRNRNRNLEQEDGSGSGAWWVKMIRFWRFRLRNTAFTVIKEYPLLPLPHAN
jgi:hypothetical protein